MKKICYILNVLIVRFKEQIFNHLNTSKELPHDIFITWIVKYFRSVDDQIQLLDKINDNSSNELLKKRDKILVQKDKLLKHRDSIIVLMEKCELDEEIDKQTQRYRTKRNITNKLKDIEPKEILQTNSKI